MNNCGWICVHRKLLNNPIVCRDSEYFSVWMYLLLNATHIESEVLFNGERITLKSGQLITGRKVIAEKFNISESKVQRILKTFENEQQIEQQTTNKNRLISILNWDIYQATEQQRKQPMNNQRTTSEQPVNTNNNVTIKKCNKKIENFVPPTLDDVRSYCQERNNTVDPERFVDFYEAKGWMVGKNGMKNWKAAVRTWEQKNRNANEKGGEINAESGLQSRRPASDFYKDLLRDWEDNQH